MNVQTVAQTPRRNSDYLRGPSSTLPQPVLNAAVATSFGPPAAPADSVDAMRAAARTANAGAAAATPAFDFPDFEAGDEFKIAKGSKMNRWGIGGRARIEELTPEHARLWIKGGKFGINREATIDIDLLADGMASLHAVKGGGRSLDLDVKVLEMRRNHARFEPVGHPDAPALLKVDRGGRLVFDFTDVQDDERFHLVLEQQE